MKVIKFYRKSQYGQEREFIDSNTNFLDKQAITSLTGQVTITPSIRTLIETLSNQSIQFEEIIAPRN